MVNGGWIDVSVAFRRGMVHWPDNPPIRITRILDMKHGDACTLWKISMGAHSGTHMDAPVHFLRGGKGLDEMPLSAVIGPARVIAIRDPDCIRVEELRPHRIRRGERILFKTRNSARVWKTDGFIKEFVYLSTEAGRYLAARRVRTVGVDYLSVGGYKKKRAGGASRAVEGRHLDHRGVGPVARSSWRVRLVLPAAQNRPQRRRAGQGGVAPDPGGNATPTGRPSNFSGFLSPSK